MNLTWNVDPVSAAEDGRLPQIHTYFVLSAERFLDPCPQPCMYIHVRLTNQDLVRCFGA